MFFVSTNLFAQVDTTKVAFVSYWSIGDSLSYKITKTKQTWKDGQMTKDQSGSYVAIFKVIESTDSSYTISWTFESDFFKNSGFPQGVSDLLAKYSITEIKYKTSEFGDFLEIINWQDVSQKMVRMFDDMTNLLISDGSADRAVVEQTLKPMRQTLTSQQGIEQMVMGELMYFHFPMGAQFDKADTLVYDDEIPTLLGGKPVKAIGQIYFEEVDFEEGYCRFKQKLSLDPGETKDLLMRFVKQLAPEEQEDFDEQLNNMVFEINDNNTFEYFFDPGFPLRIEIEREFVFESEREKQKTIERTVIELMEED